MDKRKFPWQLLPKQTTKSTDHGADQKSTFRAPAHDQVGFLARAAAKWAVILLALRQILTIGTTMVVSRYVSPEEFGIAGMVLSFVAFLVLFDTGLTWVTVQSPNLEREKVNALFAFGVLLGVLLWLAAFIAGPLLATFYGQPELEVVSLIMGAAVFLNSLTTQPAALLKRQLKQKTTNIVDTVALLISSIVAVAMAVAHTGYWAVIGQAVALQAVRSVLLFIYSGYRPTWPTRIGSAVPELKMGMGLALSNYICYFQLYLGGILVGRYFGGAILGNYQKAYGVKSMPTAYATMVVTDVMVSSLSALSTDRDRMGAAYLKALRLIAFVGCPAGAILYAIAPEVIRILYGAQWGGAVPLLEWYSVAAVALPISTTTIWLFLASGQVRLQLKMNIFLSTLAVVVLIGALQIFGTAESVVAAESLLFAGPYLVINVVLSHRAVGLRVMPTIKTLVPIIVGCLACTASAVLVGSVYAYLIWWVLLLAKISVGGVVYLSFAMAFIRPMPLVSKLGGNGRGA